MLLGMKYYWYEDFIRGIARNIIPIALQDDF